MQTQTAHELAGELYGWFETAARDDGSSYEELGAADMGITERIGLGQYAESLEVFESVASSLRDHLEA